MPTVAPRAARPLAEALPGQESRAYGHVAPRVYGSISVEKGKGKGGKPSTSHERHRQKCYTWDDSTGRARVSPEKTMDAIDDYLKAKNMTVLDMTMRRPHAPRLQPDPQEWLDASEFRATLGQLGINLTVDDVRDVFNFVDSNRDQNLQVAELERAMKRHRKRRASRQQPRQQRGPAESFSWDKYQNHPDAVGTGGPAEDTSTWTSQRRPVTTRPAERRARSEDAQGPRLRGESAFQPPPRSGADSGRGRRESVTQQQPQPQDTPAANPRDRAKTMPGNRRAADGTQSARAPRSRYETGVAPDAAPLQPQEATTLRAPRAGPRGRYESAMPDEVTREDGAPVQPRARYETGFGPERQRATTMRSPTTATRDIRTRTETRAGRSPAATMQDGWYRQPTEEWDDEAPRRRASSAHAQHGWYPQATQEFDDDDHQPVRPRSMTQNTSRTRSASAAARDRLKTVDADSLPLLCQNADPGTVLDCMNDTIDHKNLRVGDFLHHKTYNPASNGTGEQPVNPKAVRDIFLRADTNIDPDAMRDCMEVISPDGSGNMTLGELEEMLRKRRGGREPWREQEFASRQRAETLKRQRRSMSPGVRQSVIGDVVDRLYQQRPEDGLQEPDEEQAPNKGRRGGKATKEDGMRASERLYRHAAEIKEKQRKLREDWLVEDLQKMDTIGHAAAKRGADSTTRHQELYEESQKRLERREQNVLAARAQEKLQLRTDANKEITSTPEERMKHIEDLHNLHKERTEKRNKAKVEYEEKEQSSITNALERERQRREAERKAVGASSTEAESRYTEERKAPEKKPVEDEAPALKKQPELELADHALAQVNAAVSLRCGRGPEDADAEKLTELIEPLKSAIAAYRGAALVRGQKGKVNEVKLLESEPSCSSWDGYVLKADAEGWRGRRAPDVIHQLYDQADDLFRQAAIAQQHLLATIAFGEPGQTDKLGKRWPEHAIWRRPHASARCAFAYNPGIKQHEAARRKAWVRYAPATDNFLVHLTDLARAGLVFEDAVTLRAGLQDILNKFEVVDVRNYYHPGCQSLLGERHVEVLVTVSGPGLAQPLIAELRLEEQSYFDARRKVEDSLIEIGTAFAEMYGDVEGFDKGAIEYLATHTLRKPKESHCMAVFRRALRRRYGSAVAAWRTVFHTYPNANFNLFRDWCNAVNEPEHVAEYWMQADCTRAGFVSLFEIDPEAVILLAEVRMRLLDYWGGDPRRANGEDLFKWMTEGMSLHTPGKVTKHELRTILFPLDILANESDAVFHHLDTKGGDRMCHPVHIGPADISFLLKVPYMVNLRAASCGKPSSSDLGVEHFRFIKATAKGRSAEPGALQGRHAISRKARAEEPKPLQPPRYGAREIQRKASRALAPHILKMVRGRKQALAAGPAEGGKQEKQDDERRRSSAGKAPKAVAIDPAEAEAAAAGEDVPEEEGEEVAEGEEGEEEVQGEGEGEEEEPAEGEEAAEEAEAEGEAEAEAEGEAAEGEAEAAEGEAEGEGAFDEEDSF